MSCSCCRSTSRTCSCCRSSRSCCRSCSRAVGPTSLVAVAAALGAVGVRVVGSMS
jgi:hypothetical protein